MEEIGDDLDEKWIKEEESRNWVSATDYVYPVNQPVVRSTGYNEMEETQS